MRRGVFSVNIALLGGFREEVLDMCDYSLHSVRTRPAKVGEKLEPISKSPEEDNEASELYEAEEVLGVVFPTDEDAALPLNPSKEALHEPASHIAA